jgi:hypothetical protein
MVAPYIGEQLTDHHLLFASVVRRATASYRRPISVAGGVSNGVANGIATNGVLLALLTVLLRAS